MRITDIGCGQEKSEMIISFRKNKTLITADTIPSLWSPQEKKFIRYMARFINAVLASGDMKDALDELKPVRMKLADKFDKKYHMDTSSLEGENK